MTKSEPKMVLHVKSPAAILSARRTLLDLLVHGIGDSMKIYAETANR